MINKKVNNCSKISNPLQQKILVKFLLGGFLLVMEQEKVSLRAKGITIDCETLCLIGHGGKVITLNLILQKKYNDPILSYVYFRHVIAIILLLSEENKFIFYFFMLEQTSK